MKYHNSNFCNNAHNIIYELFKVMAIAAINLVTKID